MERSLNIAAFMTFLGSVSWRPRFISEILFSYFPVSFWLPGMMKGL
jgi:hypothetical protein